MNERDLADRPSLWGDVYGIELRQHFVDAVGIRTRVLEAGDRHAPPPLLIHGTSGHAETYMRNLAALSENFRVVVFDLVGHGLTDKPQVAYEIATYVDHVRRVMNAVNINQAMLSGESLGAWIAARFTIAHPNKVLRLVLNSTGGPPLDPDAVQRLRDLTLEAARTPTWDRVKERLEWLMADKAQVTPDLIACRQRMYRQPGIAEAMERILGLQDPEIRRRNILAESEFRAIGVPTLVLWTRRDPSGSIARGEELAKLIPEARLAAIENSGHWPQWEHPDQFNTLHTDFLLGRS